MVKIMLIIIFWLSILNADSFQNNCLDCHTNKFQLSMFMKKYALKFSSEKNIKKALFEYLKNPTYKKSILPFGYLNKFGIKNETILDDDELRDMVNIYYDRFNVKNRIY